MRRFVLDRSRDVNGNSGTGLVAQGVQLDNGRVVLQWLSVTASIAIFDSMQDMMRIHCRKGHDTGIEWLDESDAPGERAQCKRCGGDMAEPLTFVREDGDYYHLKCYTRLRRERIVEGRRVRGEPAMNVYKQEIWEEVGG